jgi:hypothetical protein
MDAKCIIVGNDELSREEVKLEIMSLRDSKGGGKRLFAIDALAADSRLKAPAREINAAPVLYLSRCPASGGKGAVHLHSEHRQPSLFTGKTSGVSQRFHRSGRRGLFAFPAGQGR